MKSKLVLLTVFAISWVGCKKESNNKVNGEEETIPRLVGTWKVIRSGYDINENDSLDIDEVERANHKIRRTFTKDFKGRDYFVYDDTDAAFFAHDFIWSYVDHDTTSINFLRFHPMTGERMDSFIHKILVLEDSQLVLLQRKRHIYEREYFFEFKRE